MNMISGKKIHEAILSHKEYYDSKGIEHPFRITCREHKALFNYLKPELEKDFTPGMLSEYHNVKIEVVMIVDAYIWY